MSEQARPNRRSVAEVIGQLITLIFVIGFVLGRCTG
jgi:hypothetical protein